MASEAPETIATDPATPSDSLAIEVWGTLALCSTLLLYITEIPLLKTLTLQKSTEGIQYLSILVNLVNNICALLYGILSATEVMKITNGVGTVLHLVMCLAFVGVSKHKGGALSLSVGAGAFLAGTKFYLDNIQSETERLDSLGLLSTAICFVAFTVPVLSVLEAWQTKNPSLISIPVTWGALICSICWGVYGSLLENPYIVAPNIPGVIISVAALLISSLLKNKRKTE